VGPPDRPHRRRHAADIDTSPDLAGARKVRLAMHHHHRVRARVAAQEERVGSERAEGCRGPHLVHLPQEDHGLRTAQRQRPPQI